MTVTLTMPHHHSTVRAVHIINNNTIISNQASETGMLPCFIYDRSSLAVATPEPATNDSIPRPVANNSVPYAELNNQNIFHSWSFTKSKVNQKSQQEILAVKAAPPRPPATAARVCLQ